MITLHRATLAQLLDTLSVLDSLTPTERRVVLCVLARPGSTTREIADEIYAHREDGGPDYSESIVGTIRMKIRRKLPEYDFVTHCGGWYFQRVNGTTTPDGGSSCAAS